MKHILSFVLMLMLFSSMALATQNAYKRDQTLGQLGIGIGGLGGFYGTSSLPVIAVGADFGVNEDISVGGVVGYTSSTQEFGIVVLNRPGVYKWKYTYITVAARGSYHFLKDNEKIDAYAGVGLGYNIVTASFDGDQTFRSANAASGSYLFWGIHAGGRYYFSQNFAAFAELGYGVGFLNVGISMRF